MCGLFGYVIPGGATAALPSLEAAIECLKHRGPDGEGTFTDHRGEPGFGLAHTRLAIIDLSASGRQPMTLEGGRYTIVFNGEIYNYREIVAELERCGERLHSTSDTEVIVAGYRKWGPALLPRLRGMFAFAIWDAENRTVFLARDRLGVKPLYVAEVAGGLLFASEVRALLATNLVPRVASRRALAGYLAFGSVREPETIVEGIRMVPAGHYAEFSAGKLRYERYWAPPMRIDRSISRDDALVELHQLLRETVSLRLVSDVPVGVFLSGGLDSSALVALAAELSSKPVHTFTVTFDEAAFDEACFAEEIASRFGAIHHPRRLSAGRALEELDDALASLDQPSSDGINTYFVSKAVRAAGVSVALSGIGGDELFCGYGGFRQFRGAGYIAPWLHLLKARRSPEFGLAAPMSVRKAVSLLGTRGDPFAMYSVFRVMLGPDQRHRLFGFSDDEGVAPNPLDSTISDWATSGQGDFIAAFGFFELTNYLRNTLLRDTDVMGMAHGLEIREPLLDHVLVERAMTLPGKMKLAPGRNKPMLADAVREVPSLTSHRPKLGFTLPLGVWLRSSLKGWAQQRLAGSDVIDPHEVQRMWAAFERGWLSYPRIWTLLILLDWARRHGVAIPAPAAGAKTNGHA
jgi:asparagine synthase (glutamine-hydrolysing)